MDIQYWVTHYECSGQSLELDDYPFEEAAAACPFQKYLCSKMGAAITPVQFGNKGGCP